jgi:TP901 family phage tail tape measure protein
MAVQNLGLGLLLEAKDLASGTLGGFSRKLLDVVGGTTEAGKKIQANMRAAGLGLSLFSAGVAGLALLSPAVDAAAGFSRAIAEVATETSEAVFSQKAMRAISSEMAATFGKLPLEETSALYKSVAFGANDAAKATDLMRASNMLAVAGVTDVSTAMDGIAGTIKAYGLGFDEASSISDAFFVAMKSGNTKVGELAASLGQVTPLAASLGVNYSDLLAATSTLTGKNIVAASAVTGLKAAFANVMKPTSDATAEAKKLGISFDAATLRAKGLPGFLEMITSSANYNADSMTNLFGSIEGVNAMLALASNGGADFAGVLDAMKARAGATAAGFAIMENQIQGDRFASLTELAKIAVGEGLLPLRNAVLRVANSVLEAFTKIPAPVRAFIVQAFAVGSALLVVVGGALAVKAAFSLGAAALSAMGVSAGGLIGTLLPVVAVVAAVGLAAYALKRAYDANLGGFADRVNATVASVKLALSALGQLFEEGAFSGAVMEDLNRAENSGIKAFAINLFLIANRLRAFFVGIGDGFGAALGAIEPSVARLGKSVEPIGKVFSSLFEGPGAKQAASDFDRWAAAGARVGSVLADVAAVVVTSFSFVGNLISGIVVGLSKMWPIFEGVGGAFGELGQTLSDIGKELGLAGDAGVGLGDIFFALGIGIAGVLGVIAGLVRGVVAAIAGAIRSIATFVGGLVNVIGGIIDGDWSRVWLGAKQIVFATVQAIISVFGGLIEGIASGVDALGKVVGKDLGAGNAVKDFRTRLESDARQWFGIPAPGATPVAPAAATGAATAGAAAASAAAAQTERLAAPADQLFATVAAAQAGQKPPQVNTQVLVQIDGENIPATTTTRSSTASGVPVAPAGV